MRGKRKWLIPALVVVLLAAVFLVYAGDYYRADAAAAGAFAPGEGVRVSQRDYGWYFDGPSEERALIFYPGGKVEETAYAPLLRRLAAEGMDACLVKMPFRLAVFGRSRAAAVMEEHDYARWYVGGHSLGGVMAADYAAAHPEGLAGVILFASYPTKTLDGSLSAVSIYGSEDGVLDAEKLKESRKYFTGAFAEQVIEGGNHAQFGSYGDQKGDGVPAITAEAQRAAAVSAVLDALG